MLVYINQLRIKQLENKKNLYTLFNVDFHAYIVATIIEIKLPRVQEVPFDPLRHSACRDFNAI